MTLLAAVLGLVAGALFATAVVSRLERARAFERDRRADEERSRTARTEQSTREEHARLRAALDALPVGVVVADGDGMVVARNRAAARFTGVWQSDVIVEEAAQSMMVEAVAGRSSERTIELFGPPRRTVVVRAIPLEVGAHGALVLLDDISERVRTDAVRTDFVTNISHELKTPVGALTILAETLVDADDPDDVRRLSDKVVLEAERLSRTIDDLLELSRIELGGEAVRDPVAVRPIIEGAIQRMTPIAERRGIQVETLDPIPDVKVFGDRRQLMSALGNLVENAVKYSETGGVVNVGADVTPTGVDLIVSDHGIGIPAADLDRVFERFYRVDRARSRETGGTGLGLSIVRHVATNHGGTVAVSSVEGEGSTFRLSLPFVVPDAARGSVIEERRSS